MSVRILGVRVTTPGGAVLGMPLELELTVHATAETTLRKAQVTLTATWGHHDKSWTSSSTLDKLSLSGSVVKRVPEGISVMTARVRVPEHTLPTFPTLDIPARSGLEVYALLQPSGFMAAAAEATLDIDVGTTMPSAPSASSEDFPSAGGTAVRVELSPQPAALGEQLKLTITLGKPVTADTTVTTTLRSTTHIRHVPGTRIYPTNLGAPILLGIPVVRAGQPSTTCLVTIPVDCVPSCANNDINVRWHIMLSLACPEWEQPRQLQLPITLYGTRREPRNEHDNVPPEWRTDRHRGGRVRHLFLAASASFEISQDGDPDSNYWNVFALRSIGNLEICVVFRSNQTQSLEIHITGLDLGLELKGTVASTSLTSRHDAQLRPFRRLVVPALNKLISGEFTIDDDEVHFHQPGLPIDIMRIRAVANHAESLANTLIAARAAIEPPPDVKVDLQALRALAAEWNGTLRVGDLVIRASDPNRGIHVYLDRLAGGEPLGMAVLVSLGQNSSEALRSARLAVLIPARGLHRATMDEAIGVSSETVEQLSSWPQEIAALRLEKGLARAVCTFPRSDNGNHRFVVEAERIRELYILLTTLLASFTPSDGPYR